MRIGVTAREVVRMTGIPYSTLNYWARTGFFVPAVAPGTGSGNDRLYSVSDIATLKVLVELRKGGVPLKALRVACEHLRSGISPDSRWLIISGNIITIANSNDLLHFLRKCRNRVHIVLDLLGIPWGKQ